MQPDARDDTVDLETTLRLLTLLLLVPSFLPENELPDNESATVGWSHDDNER